MEPWSRGLRSIWHGEKRILTLSEHIGEKEGDAILRLIEVAPEFRNLLQEIVDEASDFERRTGQKVKGWPDRAKALFAKIER